MIKFITSDWKDILNEALNSESFQEMSLFLENEYNNKTIYPPQDEIFNALNLTSFEKTKVVIIGQDPYHGPNQAHGLSFSVKPGCPLPRSLRNIYKELNDDLKIPVSSNGCLDNWAKQGVLLLNSVLTVEASKPNSHKNIGWESLTDSVIKALNSKNTCVVFILWGAFAQKKKELIKNPLHKIIISAHPSPLSASRGFFGSRPFSKANNYLIESGLTPINFRLENEKSSDVTIFSNISTKSGS